MSKKNTIKEIEKLFNEEHAVLHIDSTYIDRRSNTLIYTCKHGVIHTTSLANWQKGVRCTCVRKYEKNLVFYEKAKELLNKYNAVLITSFEEYKDVTTPLVFVNCKAEEQNISLNNLNVCDRFFNSQVVIGELVFQGLKQQDIAEKFNTTQHIISMCLRLWGVNNSNGNRFIEIDIPKEVLNQIYWVDKQHPKVIADKYNCSITTVIRNMEKYGIPLRTKSESRKGELNPIYEVGHTLEAKEKMSEAFVGGRSIFSNNYWGTTSKYKTPNQGIVTMRSSWEVRFADYLTSSDKDWLYEPNTFKLSNIISYRPDFYIVSEDLYVEVKGRLKDGDIVKINMFQEKGFNLLYIDRPILEEIGLINSSGKIIYDKEVLPIDLLLERYL